VTPILALDGPSRFYGKLLSGPSEVLVLGAGDGLVASTLASRGHDVVAVEASASLRALVLDRRERLAQPEKLKLVSDDPRTLALSRTFSLVIAPHQAIGLARTPDELHAFFKTVERHLAPDGTFAFDALNERQIAEGLRPRTPHLRERTHAIHPLEPLRLAAQTLDEALESVGLVAQQRFGDFSETPFSSDSPLQVVVGGRA
jgi:SAM-dependent methyltransferase